MEAVALGTGWQGLGHNGCAVGCPRELGVQWGASQGTQTCWFLLCAFLDLGPTGPLCLPKPAAFNGTSRHIDQGCGSQAPGPTSEPVSWDTPEVE